MSAVTRAVLVGSTLILILNTLGSIAARALRFEYALLAPLSSVLYLAVGAYVGRHTEGLRVPAIAGGLVGAVEATLGWAISAAIGPGAPEPGATAGSIVVTILFVTLLSAGLAALGARLGRRWRPRGARQAQTGPRNTS